MRGSGSSAWTISERIEPGKHRERHAEVALRDRGELSTPDGTRKHLNAWTPAA